MTDHTNGFTKRLNIRYPVVQAPMLGVTSPAMVAAIAASGGLGSLPLGGLPPARCRELIAETKALTSLPFAVNLFVHEIPQFPDLSTFDQMQEFLRIFAEVNLLPFERKTSRDFKWFGYREQVPVLIEAGVKFVSFTFGIPDDETIAALKAADILLIGTATCLEEAQLLEQKGIDVVAAQGIEAGGHRGSFLHPDALPQVGLMSLVRTLSDKLTIPVIAGGGITDSITMKAVFTLGAAAVQVGTLFIPAEESLAIEAYKDALPASKDVDTVLTRTFSGRWARAIKNDFIIALDKTGIAIPEYTLQNALTTPMRNYAKQHNLAAYTFLLAGQGASKAKRGSTAEIFRELVKGL